jgi:hypothetical protein
MAVARHYSITDFLFVCSLSIIWSVASAPWAGELATHPEAKRLGLNRMNYLVETARRSAGKRNEMPELRFLYENALKLSNEMARATAKANQTSCVHLWSQLDPDIQMQQDRQSLAGNLKAIEHGELTEVDFATLCALSEGWKDLYIRELFSHSLDHQLGFISCDEWLSLMRPSQVGDNDESDVMCFRCVADGDHSYSLGSFKEKSNRLPVWDAENNAMIEDSLVQVFFGGMVRALCGGKTATPPAVDDQVVRFFSSCGYKTSAQEIQQMFSTEESLRSTIRVACKRLRECDEYEEKHDMKIKRNCQTFCQLVRKDVRALVFEYLAVYIFYSLEIRQPGVVYCSGDIDNLTEDVEVDYLDRVAKALRRLAKCRNAAKVNSDILQQAVMQLRRDGRISLEQYQKAHRYIDDSRELSRVLDKLLRIFVVDAPIQLWVDLTKERVKPAEGYVYHDHKTIRAAGTSLSRISPLFPYTVAAKTSALLTETRARIKNDLSAAEYEQTRLESILLPDWFKQAELEFADEDRQPAAGGAQQ